MQNEIEAKDEGQETTGLRKFLPEPGMYQGYCDRHGAFEVKTMLVDNKPFLKTILCPQCAEENRLRESIEQEKKALQEAKNALKRDMDRAMSFSKIPSRYCGKKLSALNPISQTVKKAIEEAKKYVNNFEKLSRSGVGLCLYGTPGTGKTHMACAILQELMPSVKGLYVTTFEIFDEAKKNLEDRDSGYTERLMKAPILVIDEIGAQSGTQFEEKILLNIVDYRTANLLPTIYVSNLVPDSSDSQINDRTIREVVGDRVFQRILSQSVFVYFKGKSQRARIMSLDDVLND